MAGEKGNTEAMKNLAHVHTSGDVMEQDPIELCKMAAEEGDTNAMITLADCYKDGDGVESNDDQAINGFMWLLTMATLTPWSVSECGTLMESALIKTTSLRSSIINVPPSSFTIKRAFVG
jgi:hypothetical protein